MKVEHKLNHLYQEYKEEQKELHTNRQRRIKRYENSIRRTASEDDIIFKRDSFHKEATMKNIFDESIASADINHSILDFLVNTEY